MPSDVTGRRVGRRAAPLDHDAAPARELRRCPRRPGSSPASSSLPMMASSRASWRRTLGSSRILCAVAVGDATPGHLLQEALLGLAGGHGIAGEGVAEVGQREGAALGDGARRAHRRRAIAEQRRHLGRRLQPALAVGRQAAADLVDGRACARAGEHVVDAPLRRRGVADVVGGDHADAERVGLRLGGARAVRLGRVEVALRLQEDVRARRRRRSAPADRRAAPRPPARSARPRARPAARRVATAAPLACPAFVHARDQPAQVLVAAPILDQQQQRRAPPASVTSAPTIGRTPVLARRREEARRARQTRCDRRAPARRARPRPPPPPDPPAATPRRGS